MFRSDYMSEKEKCQCKCIPNKVIDRINWYDKRLPNITKSDVDKAMILRIEKKVKFDSRIRPFYESSNSKRLQLGKDINGIMDVIFTVNDFGFNMKELDELDELYDKLVKIVPNVNKFGKVHGTRETLMITPESYDYANWYAKFKEVREKYKQLMCSDNKINQ